MRRKLKNRIVAMLSTAAMTASVFTNTAVYAQNVNEEMQISTAAVEEAAEEQQSLGVTLVWPVPGHTRISQGFHDGKAIDISDGSITGASVCAALGGTVTNIFLCGNTHHNAGDCNGFGTGLVIKGDDGRFYQYAHMQAGSIPAEVYRGARVEAGAHIGRVGMTGFAYGVHLHFGISTGTYWNESGINPQNENYTYNNTPAAVTMGWGNDDCQPGDSNARIAIKAMPSVRGTFTQAGAVVWDASGKEVASKTENINTPGSYLDVWYDITGEMGAVLKSGSPYTYQFFVVFNGTRYTSPVKNFSTTESTSAAVAMEWGNDDCQPGDSDARIAVRAMPSVRGTFTQAGAVVWDASGKEAASKTEDINTPGSHLDIWYDITEEMGAVLESGSTYTYQFFVVFNGTRYTSSVKSFSTLGGSSEPTDPDDPEEGVCDHIYGDWETVAEATVFEAEQQERGCSLCGETETRENGTKLTPTIRLNTTNITLKTLHSTTKVKVSGLAAGDRIQSWKTSNSKIVVVSRTGWIVAKNTPGSAVITVTLASGKTAQIKVKVQKTDVLTTKISGLNKNLSMRVKGTTVLKPVISPITSTQKVTYKTSNKKIVTVSGSGKVTAKKKGKAAITVKSGKKSFVINVTVK